MHLRHLVAGLDDSDAGKESVRFALRLGARVGARVTVLRVLAAQVHGPEPAGLLRAGIERMVAEAARIEGHDLPVAIAWAQGIPQVEIPRFAERASAGLIVLGRKPRSRHTRLMLGDTADAVVRRSLLPTVSVPSGTRSLDRLLAALDGTDRGLSVLRFAMDLAAAARVEFHAVSVEPDWPGAPGEDGPRGDRLLAAIEENQAAGSRRHQCLAAAAVSPLQVLRGEVVPEVVRHAEAIKASLLITGFHPGGPLLDVDQRSVSRRLLHSARCPVLTVPL